MDHDLDQLDPEQGRQMYLDERRHELTDATLQSHDYRLKQFVAWCEEDGIDDLNDLSGRDLHRFRVKRREEDEFTTASTKGQLATLRMFLRFCATIDAVKPGLDEKIILPKTTEEDVRDEMVDSEQAAQILNHLERFRYATLEHAFLAVLWHTGLRVGAATGIDVCDYDSGEQYLELVHRPDQETTLKSGEKSERLVALSESVCEILNDWLAVNHPGVTDDYDRTPLFATRRDRLSKNRARSIAYEYTQPCVYGDECPYGREIEECDARDTAYAHKCPSSLSPHIFRRGAITHHLREKTPKPIVSNRMDVGMDTLEKHYDQRTEREKLEKRRQYLPDKPE